MSDVRADDDDDRLPWLEAVDEEDTDEGPSAGKLIASVVVGLATVEPSPAGGASEPAAHVAAARERQATHDAGPARDRRPS